MAGSHKRTLSGVVAEVSQLNKNSITNKEYNFSDLLGDIYYINDDGKGNNKESEEEPLTKKQLAEKKRLEAASPKTQPGTNLKMSKQQSKALPFCALGFDRFP